MGSHASPPPVLPRPAKTINELLEEFNQPPYTVADYRRDLAAIHARFLERGIQPDQIASLIWNHEIAEDELVQDWIELNAFTPFMNAASEGPSP